MAQKVHIELVDDVNGKPADETVTFGLDGKVYEIDLSEANATKLRKVLDGYVSVARKVPANNNSRRQTRQTLTNTREVRDWARSNGFEVSDRGQIPKAVHEAFAAAR